MKFSLDVRASATRHLQAADVLDEASKGNNRPHRAVAGYMYGIAAECALKQMMRESGIRPLPDEQRQLDPFYAHFPRLKTLLRDMCEGRRANELYKYASDGSLMSEWDTDMRYAPAKDVKAAWVDRWKIDAHNLVNAMEDG